MIITFIRTIILYFTVMLAMRIMGKRQIGDMQPFELVVTIMISDIASAPMQATQAPLIQGVVPIFTLVIIEVCFSFVALKSRTIRRIVEGKESILIKDGRIRTNELERLRINYDDLIEQLRQKDIRSIDEVELAIMETNGEFSVIPKTEARPLTPGDLNMNLPQEKMPYVVVSDGEIITENLAKSNITSEKISKEMKKRNIKLSDVAMATYSEQDGLVIKKKQKKKKGDGNK